MTKVLIIGSGPAAAGVALALTRGGNNDIHVVDLGGRLERDKQSLLESVADQPPAEWEPGVARQLTQHPARTKQGELPEKRVFGSDFVFRDSGQLSAFTTVAGGNRHAVSSAFGGFSNVWGAQVMPFSRATIDQWPISYDELIPHYEAILKQIPFAGADDDYSDLFPLIANAAPLPPLSPSSAAVIAHYQRRRGYIKARGVTVGAARLALRAAECIECGLCLTGCPLGLIYSSSQTISALAAAGNLSYTDGLLALRVGQDDGGPWAVVRDTTTEQTRTLRADSLFIACGGMGTTRLMLASARPEVRELEMKESVQLVLPFVSTKPQRDPHDYTTFTLNQFNVLVEYGRSGLDLAQFHLYPYNRAYEDALPNVIKTRPAVALQVLRRTVAALGYLPSWASPKIRLQATPALEGELPPIAMSAIPNAATSSALRGVFRRLLAVAPALDLWPVVPTVKISGPGKSYHFGASFPHVGGRARAGELETDRLGRVAEWSRVHLVDGSVFPSVPATTFTLTVMANAHRIASEAMLDAAR